MIMCLSAASSRDALKIRKDTSALGGLHRDFFTKPLHFVILQMPLQWHRFLRRFILELVRRRFENVHGKCTDVNKYPNPSELKTCC